MRRTPHTPTRTARRTLTRGLALWLFGATFLVISAMNPPRWAEVPASDTDTSVWAAHADECWQNGDPALSDKAGAAVIRWGEGGQEYVTRPRLVSLAEDEVLGMIGYGTFDDPRFDVVGLCL